MVPSSQFTPGTRPGEMLFPYFTVGSRNEPVRSAAGKVDSCPVPLLVSRWVEAMGRFLSPDPLQKIWAFFLCSRHYFPGSKTKAGVMATASLKKILRGLTRGMVAESLA